LARDYPRWIVAGRVQRQEWKRLGRGAFLPSTVDDPTDLALAHLVAVHHRAVAPHWFSHESAALLWGLALPGVPAVCHLRQATRPAAHQDGPVRRHCAPVEPVDQALVNGLPVTGLALTAADCLRMFSPLDGLVVADTAVRAGADLDRIREVLRGPGSVSVWAVASLADPGAESPAESAARYHLLVAGLPAPMVQVPIEAGGTTYWGDMGYPQWKVVIEYDGQGKYDDPHEYFRERERQQAIEAQGWRVVRLTSKDLNDPGRLVRRVLAVLPEDIPLTRRPYLRAQG